MTNYQTVRKWANAQRPLLRVRNFNQIIDVEHSDRSTFHFTHAFAVKVDEFIVVFTEHTDYHVFYEDDLRRFPQDLVVATIEEPVTKVVGSYVSDD